MSAPAAAYDATVSEFHELVNMSAASLAAWLKTDKSKSVGWVNESSSESVGHVSGRHIVRILRKRRRDYTSNDVDHMRKIVGYIKRHAAPGGPKEDQAHSRWAYSPKNWGHDPLT